MAKTKNRNKEMIEDQDDEVDIGSLIKLLDKCLLSKNDNIKKSLRELLVVVALSENNEGKPGPLETLMCELQELQDVVRGLKREVEHIRATQRSSVDDYSAYRRKDKDSWTSYYTDEIEYSKAKLDYFDKIFNKKSGI